MSDTAPGSTPPPDAHGGATEADWSSVRLHIVSGKGGTGKTTMAAALAIALATGGRKVLLVEVEGRQGLAQVFNTPPLEYGEHRIAGAPGGGNVFALSVEPEAAMLEYLELFYNIKRGGAALRRVGAVDFATTIAPGLRDVLLTGKVGESVRRKEGRGFLWDAVVVDAPPTGRIARFLTANSEASDLARVGPIKNQATLVMGVLRSEQTAVHLVTLLEEMPVQETVDGMADLAANQLPMGGIIVNMTRPHLLSDTQMATVRTDGPDLDKLADDLRSVGLESTADNSAALDGLGVEASDHVTRVDMERDERKRLSGHDVPLLEIPQLPEGIDVAALYGIAELLREQGVA